MKFGCIPADDSTQVYQNQATKERAADLAQAERLAGLEPPKFATGTLVQLLSGGPAMTVASRQRNDDLIVAQWFDGAKLMQDTFDPESLVLHSDAMAAART